MLSGTRGQSALGALMLVLAACKASDPSAPTIARSADPATVAAPESGTVDDPDPTPSGSPPAEITSEPAPAPTPESAPDATSGPAARAESARVRAWELIDAGDNRAARSVVDEALPRAIADLGPDARGVQSLWNALGVSAGNLGDVVTSVSSFRKLVEIRSRTLGPRDQKTTGSRLNLATALKLAGDPSGAEAEFMAVSEALFEGLPTTLDDWLRARHGLSNLLVESQETERARALLEEELGYLRARGGPDDVRVAECLLNLGSVQGQLGDAAGGLAHAERAVAILERELQPAHPALLQAHSNLAVLLFLTGDVESALRVQEDLVATWEKTVPDDHMDRVQAEIVLSGAQIRAGRSAEALERLESLDERLARPGAPAASQRDSVLHNLAMASRDHGDLERALGIEKDLLVRSRRERGDPAAIALRANHVITLAMLGDDAATRVQLEELGEDLVAQALAAIALSSREASEVLTRNREHLDKFLCGAGRGAASQPAPERAFRTVETLRHVASGGEHAGVAADAQSTELDAELLAVRRRIDDLARDRSPGAESQQAALVLERDRLERQRRESRPGSRDRRLPLDARSIALALAPDSAAAGFVRTTAYSFDPVTSSWREARDVYVAHTLDRGGAVKRIDLGDADSIDQVATAWRAALVGVVAPSRGLASASPEGSAGQERELGNALRQRLIDPVLAAVGDVRRLHVALDGSLQFLPLDALPAGSARLGDDLTIVREVSFGRLLAPRVEETSVSALQRDLLVAGGIDYGPVRGPEDVAELPGAATEVADVVAAYRSAGQGETLVLAGLEATPADLVELAPRAGWIHLATHGWFRPDSSKSTRPDAAMLLSSPARVQLAPWTLCGLALSGANQPGGGRISAEQLAGLDLAHCRLAVLSACETGLGAEHGVAGVHSLQSALLAAGARTVVASLWKVDDRAARDFMQSFYRGLWVEGLVPLDALRKAQRALRERGDPPSAWAAWVLSGDPD